MEKQKYKMINRMIEKPGEVASGWVRA